MSTSPAVPKPTPEISDESIAEIYADSLIRNGTDEAIETGRLLKRVAWASRDRAAALVAAEAEVEIHRDRANRLSDENYRAREVAAIKESQCKAAEAATRRARASLVAAEARADNAGRDAKIERSARESWQRIASTHRDERVVAEAERDELRKLVPSQTGWWCKDCRLWASPYVPGERPILMRSCPNNPGHALVPSSFFHVERDDATAERDEAVAEAEQQARVVASYREANNGLAAALKAAEARAEKLQRLVGDEDVPGNWHGVPRSEAIRQAGWWFTEHDKRRAERDEARARVADLEGVIAQTAVDVEGYVSTALANSRAESAALRARVAAVEALANQYESTGATHGCVIHPSCSRCCFSPDGMNGLEGHVPSVARAEDLDERKVLMGHEFVMSCSCGLREPFEVSRAQAGVLIRRHMDQVERRVGLR